MPRSRKTRKRKHASIAPKKSPVASKASSKGKSVRTRDTTRVTRSSARALSPPLPTITAPSLFLTLPVELHYAVIELLSSSDLLSLSLCNQELYTLLYPTLYKRLLTATLLWPQPAAVRKMRSAPMNVDAIQWAASLGQSVLLKRLLVDMNVDLRERLVTVDRSGRTLLARAAESEDVDTVLLVLGLAKELELDDQHVIGHNLFRYCTSWRVFSILSEEASTRLKKRGFR